MPFQYSKSRPYIRQRTLKQPTSRTDTTRTPDRTKFHGKPAISEADRESAETRNQVRGEERKSRNRVWAGTIVQNASTEAKKNNNIIVIRPRSSSVPFGHNDLLHVRCDAGRCSKPMICLPYLQPHTYTRPPRHGCLVTRKTSNNHPRAPRG